MNIIHSQAISLDTELHHSQCLQEARRVLELEAEALTNLASVLDQSFVKAIDLILETKGRVIVTGMGKSGHIASKIAATFASTGTPSFSVHPAELAHGDFGMLTETDIVIAISNSGETAEITSILGPIKRRGLKLIGISSNDNSTLAEYSEALININIKEEACPLNLAPTSSTTASLAIGDALAVVLMKQRNFSREDFAQFHPGGALGKQLIKVADVMRSELDNIPTVSQESLYSEVLQEISRGQLGFTCVLDEKGKLIGSITDGDLRRAQLAHQEKTYQKQAHEIMNRQPKVISQKALASGALNVMESWRISILIIISEEQKPIGVLDLKDLLKAGLI